MRKSVPAVVFSLALAWTSSFSQPSSPPRLIIIISIDQMRADYFERFGNEFTGGLGRLFHEGVVYTNADLNYALSETGPGHASLATGSYPATNGIPGNDWIDPATRKRVYCVDDPQAAPVEGEGGGRSPANLAVTAIGDWLKAASPNSKVVSVAMKDRSAILMGGKQPNYAFWYNRESGHMVTSSFYASSLPAWVKNFNRSNWIERHVPAVWTKLKPEHVYAQDGPDEMAGESKWDEDSSFPHPFQLENRREQFLTSPWGDMLVLDFALAAARAEKLGKRDATDLLAIGLSCTDYVGHAFGPNSHEVHDHLLRVDAALGKFFKAVEKLAGKGNFLVALSADHAVMPLPEYLTEIKKNNVRRIIYDRELRPKILAFMQQLQNEAGTSEPLVQENAFLNYAAAAKSGLDSLALEQKIRDGLLQVEGIADVFFRRELIDKSTPDRPYLGHFQRSYFPGRGEGFQIRFCENCLVTSRTTGTSHGSTYRYDTHVPVIFWGHGLQAAKIDRAIYSVDVAPTLAKILDVNYPTSVEGEPLIEIISEE